ncbi:hypothetical protein J6590_085758 [Homalodisca vitripennis]|nr:hypothetical protein J6590_085758 [Homalodisca vitripennis]
MHAGFLSQAIGAGQRRVGVPLSALTTCLHNGHISLPLRVRQSAPRNLTLFTCFYQRASWTYPMKGGSAPRSDNILA